MEKYGSCFAASIDLCNGSFVISLSFSFTTGFAELLRQFSDQTRHFHFIAAQSVRQRRVQFVPIRPFQTSCDIPNEIVAFQIKNGSAKDQFRLFQFACGVYFLIVEKLYFVISLF